MKNKLIKLLVALSIIAACFTSCSDALEEPTYGALTTEEFLKENPDNFASMLSGIYAQVKWLHDHWTYWGLNTLTSDEAVCPIRQPGGHWGDGSFWRELNTHNWTNQGDAFKYVWDYCNNGAVLCNKILGSLETYKDIMDEASYNAYKAELVIVRSFYYYTLFDCFGKIPYAENFSGDFVPQLEPEEVWKKLVAALEENAPHMNLNSVPSKAYNYACATQGMAYTLLARLYLNAESYDVSAATIAEYDVYNKCVVACDKIINSGEYAIESDFFSNFAIQNGNSRENIFVIEEDGTNNNAESGGYPMNKMRLTMLTLHYQHQQAWDLIEKPWNGFSATEEFIAKYAPEDARGLCDNSTENGGTRVKERRGWFVGPVRAGEQDTILVDENGTEVVITTEYVSGEIAGKPGEVDDCSWNSGARCWKYEVDTTGTYKYCENDFVIFRYADVLYMKAEAILRGATGNISEVLAMPDFQLMRTRVGLQPYTSLDLNEIYDERGREFAWEMVRRRDMIRFGTYTSAQWGFITSHDSYRKWFPIHYEVLTTEPRWSQLCPEYN